MKSVKSNLHYNIIFALALSFITVSCGKDNTKKDNASKNNVPNDVAKKDTTKTALKKALTFYSSFDKGIDADFSLGDPKLYTVPSRKARDSAQVGLHKKDISIAEGQGLKGDALLYSSSNKGYIYYASKDNIAYNNNDWNGAVSFWLSLDPATDLEPGYCDPIQITDVSYNDASIWVDFTKENPRDFRLGVIGDKTSWKKDTTISDNDDSVFKNQLIPVSKPPFAKGTWTHIFINFKSLNTERGEASLYINGELKGKRDDITDPFSWELEKSNIYLGLGYIGLMDELSIFNRNLTQQEISALFALENGVHTLLK
ncbi:LamG-like jellyroll fold domain-containing protein [uncultured Aquimarina sp.]|uniref:LamG-like jellyroll fold domain-containing protein n=1 Tax=uncultured Aquimarina sp. TaxID=575652 RepID=UPI0026368179|nr:LamG-like jellyroll fold domain-containing protein [uncultured Aquimarina sp.]